MKRLKKILKWTGIVLGGLAAIGLVANAVFVWTTDTRLERQLAAIRAAGDPLTLADLARPPIPPEKNADTYLRRAEADMAAIGKETMNLRHVSEYPGFLMPPEDQKTVKAAFAAYPNVIPLLEQAAACPDYDAELDYTLPLQEFTAKSLDVGQKPRLAARVLRCRAALLVAHGNRDEAVRTALLIFRLARHFDHDPILLGCLVASVVRGYAVHSANEALQTGPISKEVRNALDAELVIQEPMEGFSWAMKSERAFGIDSFGTFPLRRFWLGSRAFWNREESEYLDATDAFAALTRDPRPYRQTAETFNSVYERVSHPLTKMIVPAIQAAHSAVTRTRAMIRCLRVLNALQTHVPAGSNEAPKLAELGLPAETTTDPFTGEPLHVKKTPQGWLVYSVGQNFQDDGGKLDYRPDGDVGIGPPAPVIKPAGK